MQLGENEVLRIRTLPSRGSQQLHQDAELSADTSFQVNSSPLKGDLVPQMPTICFPMQKNDVKASNEISLTSRLLWVRSEEPLRDV